MDERLRVPCRRVRDLITLQQQLDCTSGASLGIGVHRAKRLPGRDSVTNFPMQNDSNRRVDGIFLFLAPAAKNDTGSTNRFTIHCRDITAPRAAYILDVFRSRTPFRIVERAGVSTLQAHHLAEFLQRLPRDYELLSVQLALRHGIRSSAQMKHPAREF